MHRQLIWQVCSKVLWPTQPLIVGRLPQHERGSFPRTQFLVIPSSKVSSCHFRIYCVVFDPDDPHEHAPLYYCEDLQSLNGTWLARSEGGYCLIGRRGFSNCAQLLNNGDTIIIKPYWKFTFRASKESRPSVLDDLQEQETQVS